MIDVTHQIIIHVNTVTGVVGSHYNVLLITGYYFTGLIHDKFDFCTSNQLQMPFDPEIVGWLSATETIDELFNWFNKKDIEKLEKHGYSITLYAASEYKYHNNHWVIKQNNSRLVKCLPLASA